LASQRPSVPTGLTRPRLHLGLFGHLEGVVDLDAEVADRALQLGMPEQELDDANSNGECPSGY